MISLGNFVLKNIRNTIITADDVANKNCENFVGATQIPLGIAGPLKINQNKSSHDYYLPLTTTEGALIASVNRGCKATHQGGINTFVDNVGITRAPLFKTKGVTESQKIVADLKKTLPKLNDLALSTSSHIALLGFEDQIVGKNLWLRFSFDTAEAMGMNMVTKASEKISQYIETKYHIKCLAISGNYCSDKKATWVSFIRGRGKKVWAEATVDYHTCLEVLKTSPEKIVEIVKQKSQLGSIVAGSLGFNAHFANVIAALFLSTGQDAAHVSESSMGITEAEVESDGNLYFSVYLPSLIVGTVGGGTTLPTQTEALDLLDLGKRPYDVLKFSEIIAAAVLTGELSLTAALASGDLVSAHQKLGKGKK
ncbi:MAG TPA: hydroxymethylglutaryl-CoA reductase [bacterium]|nr:hydroxymethylglutaryl-CoA reductase [bacterium]